jgi:hypothetical protein
VKRQIDSIYDMMEQAAVSKEIKCPHCKKKFDTVGADSRELDQLSRAYDRLFKAWQVLSQTPGPGQRKPATMRQRGQSAGQASFHEPEVLPNPPSNPPGDTPTSGSATDTPKA